MVGTARCAVPVAERKRQATEPPPGARDNPAPPRAVRGSMSRSRSVCRSMLEANPCQRLTFRGIPRAVKGSVNGIGIF